MKKKEYILSINPCIYGLNYHDPGAAIISNGNVLFAVEEERLNGIKGAKGFFPSMAIKACLDYCNINSNQIKSIAIAYEPQLWMHRMQLEVEEILKKSWKNNQYDAKMIIDKIEESNLLNRYRFFESIDKVNALVQERANLKVSDIRYYSHHLSHIAASYECSKYEDAVGIVVDGIGESECRIV